MEQALPTVVLWVTRLLEMAGIGVVVIGALLSIAIYIGQYAKGSNQECRYSDFRSNLGRSILLGLEFLVAGDIVNTVAVDPTLESLVVLAGIVIIRTFLSFSLEVELEGRWPWQRQARRRDNKSM